MARITDAQRKALAALYLLHQSGNPTMLMRHRMRNAKKKANKNPKFRAFHRWEIGRVSKGDCSSYPLATMLALRKQGLVAPLHEDAVDLVELNICTCGCDLWRITRKGRELAESWNIKGHRPRKHKPLDSDDLNGMLGGRPADKQDSWWKDGEPPEYDPNSPSQKITD